MGQPIIQPIIPFDATKPYSIKFTYVGNQVVKHVITVKDNTTNAIVYTNTKTTFQLEHVIPENTLINGKSYNVSIMVYDNADAASELSTSVVFSCLTTPLFGFANITPNQIIKNTSFEVQLSYSQQQGEQLNSWQIVLYDYSQKVLYKTDIYYDISTLKTTINSLSDSNQYFLQAIGETVNKISVSTNLIPISVSYQTPNINGLLSLTNLKEQGRMRIATNVHFVDGKPNMEYPIFIDGSKINLIPFGKEFLLTNDGIANEFTHYTWDDSVVWDDMKKWTETDGKYYDDKGNFLGHFSPSITYKEGFNVEDDVVMCFKGENFQYFTEIVEADSDKYHISIKYLKGIFEGNDIEKAYCQLDILNDVISYVTVSNYINVPKITDTILIYLKIKNNICDFQIKNMSTGV